MKKDEKKSKDAPESPSTDQHTEAEANVQVQSILHIPGTKELSTSHCCGGLTFIVLGALTILITAIEIIVASFGAATEQYYDAPHSGRLVAMVVLAVIGALTIGVVVYAIIGVRKKHTKPLHTTAVVLLVLVVVDALITGLAVKVTEKDELNISRALSESFVRARNGDQPQIQIWETTQAGLECCGLYSPEDYRDPYGPLNFPPDVPASCCPTFKYPNATKEKNLDMCKANGTYFRLGCKLPILDVVKVAANSVIAITVLKIIAESMGKGQCRLMYGARYQN